MRKNKTLLLAGLGLFLTVGILVGIVVLLKHEPGFYRRADVEPGKTRKGLSGACFGQFLKLVGCWKDGKGEWDVTFSEGQINSYFAEDFIRLGDAEALRKHGMTDPRVVMENDKLRFAFRYGAAPWSAIISYDLKLWVAPRDTNVVCVEILGRHAGALPISTQSLLNDISDVAARNGVEVTWYRLGGNPVALVRFQADRTHTPVQLRRLEVKDGVISVGGLSVEPLLTDRAKIALVPVGN